MLSRNQCIVANVDADAQLNKPLAAKYSVSGYPTILFFPKDNKESPLSYEGGRGEADFVGYLNEKCGTQRAVGGGLDDKVIRFQGIVSRGKLVFALSL
jgi:protein disulfide-isomerase A6